MPTSVPNFSFPAPLVTEIKRVSQNLMWGLLAPYRIPYAETFVYAEGTWQGQTACRISASYIMQLCKYVFPIGLPLYVPKNGVLGVLRVKMWKYCLLTPKGTTLREYASAGVSRVKIGSTAWAVGRLRFCVQRNKKMSGNFGYMGRSNPWGDLDQMSLLGRYGGLNHVCNIWWLSIKGCGCGERGKFAFSHWLDASPLQHCSHYCVTVWYIE